METNEKTVQQLQGEKARLTFEKKSWEKEAMRLEEEVFLAYILNFSSKLLICSSLELLVNIGLKSL